MSGPVEEELKFIKCVVAGDGAVGKTCMLMSYATNKFPTEYIPTVFDNYAVTVTIRGTSYQLGLFDTAGQGILGCRFHIWFDIVQRGARTIDRSIPRVHNLKPFIATEEYEGLRLLSYPGTHVFLLSYSVVMPDTMKNLELKWLPEVRSNCPTSAFLIVGTQIDLREDEKIRQKLQKRRQKPVTLEEGTRLAKRVNADCYVECSALTKTGLKDVFDEALLAVLEPKIKRRAPKKKSKCVIL